MRILEPKTSTKHKKRFFKRIKLRLVECHKEIEDWRSTSYLHPGKRWEKKTSVTVSNRISGRNRVVLCLCTSLARQGHQFRDEVLVCLKERNRWKKLIQSSELSRIHVHI
ncbi:hypothetical protein CEXT_386111 [Caerostris extrusa]|uniref:Uncharacterized protein n=1 Tax=Caerostris extrusa TaxID=172846 RepID=A0AAV4QDN8_CAEEX|nr:hypothetical protein CEXT_386111 [Caerostris extrusa]